MVPCLQQRTIAPGIRVRRLNPGEGVGKIKTRRQNEKQARDFDFFPDCAKIRVRLMCLGETRGRQASGNRRGKNSQVKEPGTDVSLESDITPKKQGCRFTGLRRLNLSGTMTGLAGKTQNAWCCEPFFGFGDRQKTALRKKEGT